MSDNVSTIAQANMAEDAISTTESPNTPPARRGRKPGLTIVDKVANLKAQLAEAEAKARETEKERAGIVGKVAIEGMRENEEFASLVRALLRDKVRSARDKAAIADLLVR